MTISKAVHSHHPDSLKSEATKITGWLRTMAAMDEADEPAIKSPHRVAADFIDKQQRAIEDIETDLKNVRDAE